MKTIELRKPIHVNNQAVKILSYDPDAITNDLYLAACAKSSISGNAMNASVMLETDKALHLKLGMAAILAANPHMDWNDVERICGPDLLTVSNIGRFFILGKSEELYEENTSEERSETSAGDTTPLSQTSGNGG